MWVPRRPLGRRPAVKEALIGMGLVSVIVGISGWLTGLYLDNWERETGSVVWTLLVEFGRLLKPWLPAETLLFVYIFPVGLLLGTVVVWAVDDYKRYQAVFLSAALAAGLAVAALNGRLLVTLLERPTGTNLFSLLVGVVAGIQISGVNLIGAVRDQSTSALGDRPREFPRAPKLVFAGFLVVFAVNFVDYHFLDATAPALIADSVRAQQLVVPHFLAGVVALGAFRKFTEYESEIRTVQVGPARAGKTATFAGLYEYLDETDDYRIDDGREAFDQDLIDSLEDREFPERNEVADRDERSAQWLKIPFVSKGWFFRKRIVLATLDYPGELICGIAPTEVGTYEDDGSPSLDKAIQQYRESDDYTDDPAECWSQARDWLKQARKETEGDDRKVNVARKVALIRGLARAVEGADTLVLTVPLDDFAQRLAAQGALPEYVRAYWVREDKNGGIWARTVDGADADLSDLTPDVDRLPTYDHDDYGRVRLFVEDEFGQRASSDEYRAEYEALIDRYGTDADSDEQKRFIWTVTKSDYAESQFETAFKRTTNADFSGHTLADIVDTKPRFVPDRAKAQKLFARWIEALLDSRHNWNGFRDGLRARTGERFVYPLWYQIDNDEPPTGDEELTIDDVHGPLLQGAPHLIDRIEHRPFVEQLGLGSLAPWRRTESKADRVVEEMERAYEAERRRDDDADSDDGQTTDGVAEGVVGDGAGTGAGAGTVSDPGVAASGPAENGPAENGHDDTVSVGGEATEDANGTRTTDDSTDETTDSTRTTDDDTSEQ